MESQDSKSVVRPARDEPIPPVQVSMPGDDEYSATAIRSKKARHSIEHWVNMVNTI